MRAMRGIAVFNLAAVLFFSGNVFSQAPVSLSGTVMDSSSYPLPDATVRLVGGNLSAETEANGTFLIIGTVGVLPGGPGIPLKLVRPFFKGSQLVFSIPASPQQVRIDLYNVKGARIAAVLDQRFPAGTYHISPIAAAGRPATSMLYLVRVQIGSDVVTLKAPCVAGATLGQGMLPLQPAVSSAGLEKAVLAARDSLEVSLCGYGISRVPVDSFTQSGIAVVMRSTELSNPGAVRRVDSLFNALRDLIGSLDSVNSPAQLKSRDFASLRDGFHAILTNENSLHMKANVGFIVSSVLALNTDTLVWRLVDSLDAYFTAIDSGGMHKRALAKKPGLMRQTMSAGGVAALGKSLAAVSLPGLSKLAPSVSFPKFITIAYIQSIIENNVMPVLDSVIVAAGRIEDTLSCGVLALPVDRDTFELDKGEIYPLDAGLHLLRACLNGLCAYEMELYAAGTTDYSWIDTLQSSHSSGRVVYSLLGDTLDLNTQTNDTAMGLFIFRSIKYNMQRSGFLTLRGNTITRVKSDLLAVPAKFKAGLAYLRAEAGRNRPDDIIKLTDIAHMDNDLVDVPGNLISHGVSATLANNFQTPESIADFITQVLSGPYVFDETIDGTHIAITVNLTAMLDNPVSDLRTLILPSYEWLPDSEWTIQRHDYEVTPDNGRMFCCNSEDSIAIDASHINYIIFYPASNSKCCYLNVYYNWRAETDSSIGINIPVALLDSIGNRIPFDQIDSLIQAKTFLPYFNDYTFGGLFPAMNRRSWINLIYQ